MRTVVRLGVIASIATVALALPVAAAQREVVLQGNAFDPRTIEINVGDEIRWRHEDGDSPHAVTTHAGQQESFDSHPNCSPLCMQDGNTFEHTFDKAGTFTYYCKTHGSADDPNCAGMCGKVVVKGAAQATAPPEQPASAPPPTQPPSAPPPTQPPARAPAPAVVRASPTPTPEPTQTPAETEEVTAPPLAAEESEDTSGRGAILGIAIAAAALAGAGGFLASRRFGGAGA